MDKSARFIFLKIVIFAGLIVGYDAGNCCYYLGSYEKNEISDVISLVKNESSGWNLLTNISWPSPDTSQVNYTIDRYAVSVEELQNPDQLTTIVKEGDDCQNCLLQPEDIITHSLWHVFKDLWFGTEYVFNIYLIRTKSIIYKGIFFFIHDFKTPDCYLATQGDGEFCKSQGVQVSGILIDLRVDDVVPQDDRKVTVTMSWIPPVHVRPGSRLEAYTAKYHAISKDIELEDTIIFNIKAQNQTNWRERQVTELTGLNINTTYLFNIEPLVRHADNSPLQNGNPSEVTFGTFIVEFGNCSCGGLKKYQRICQPEDVNCTNTIESRTCKVGDECIQLTEFEKYIAAGVVLLIIPIVLFVIVLKKYWCRPNRIHESIKSIDEELYSVDPAFKNYEIPSQTHVRWDERKLIGNGRFGMVYSCRLSEKGNTYRMVAVKTPLETASAAEKMDFKKEIQLMSQIGKHTNVIELIGCRTTKDPMYIITPLMQYGSLLDLLRKSSKMKMEGVFTEAIYDLKLKDLFSIGRQIAVGMEYISSLRIVHGDLAARNVFMGEGLVAKVGDFGLGQDAYEKGYLRLKDGEVPVKWYSLETLLEHFITPMSDVWSFGVLLYEIFTFGKSPYPGIIIGTLPQLLQRGYRMQRPENCPSTAYKLMRMCWHENPKKRPTFTMLFHQLDTILEFLTNDTNMYLKLADGRFRTSMTDRRSSKPDEFEFEERQLTQRYKIDAETDNEENTGQTISVQEFIPLMDTSSQYGGKICDLTNSLSHYDFKHQSERSDGASAKEVMFIPIFDDSGTGNG